MNDFDLRAAMPHQPPMLLIDRLVRMDGELIEAEAIFPPDSPFADADGRIDEAVYFELMAQAFAAGSAAESAAACRKAAPGYLASLRNFAIHGRARAGETLRITVRQAGRVDKFFVIAGEVDRSGETLAAGQITLLLPEG